MPFKMKGYLFVVASTEVFLILLLEYGLSLKFRVFFLPSNIVTSYYLSLSFFSSSSQKWGSGTGDFCLVFSLGYLERLY